jgi:tetratricopeptide (TPR) repeat protein
MALKNVRLVWGTPPTAGGSWRLGLFSFQPIQVANRPQRSGAMPDYWKNYTDYTLNLNLRSLLWWCLGALVAGYFGAAVVLLQRLKNANPYTVIHYIDLVNPLRWSELPRLRGESFAALGRVQLKAGKFSEGLTLLRMGLERNPTDSETRLDVGKLYVALRLREQAIQLLGKGLEYKYPGREYVEFYLGLVKESDQPEELVRVLELAKAKLLAIPRDQRATGDATWLHKQIIPAMFAANLDEEALALVEESADLENNFRREVTSLYLLKKNRAAEAQAYCAKWAAEEPSKVVALTLWARSAREAKDFVTMDIVLDQFQKLKPSRPEALLYRLSQNKLAGRDDAVQSALDLLFFRFGASEDLYSPLCTLLVELGFTEALDRVEREVQDRGLSMIPVLWSRLQHALVVRDWQAVTRNIELLEAQTDQAFTPAQKTYMTTIQLLASACLDSGRGAQLKLTQNVSASPGTLKLYLQLINALYNAGRFEGAKQILVLAEGTFASSRTIIDLRNRIESALALAESVEPSAPVNTNLSISTSEAFTAAFQKLTANNKSDEALQLITQVRRQSPDWLPDSAANLDMLELPLRAKLEDQIRLQVLVRTILARNAKEAKPLFDLARALYKEGHADNAILLVKEILRRDPQMNDAIRQLNEWVPPQSESTP